MIGFQTKSSNHKSRKIVTRKILLSLIGVLALSACGASKPSQFYVLNALSPSELSRQTISVGSGLAIGLAPVNMPEYLDRPQIISRGGGNQLELGEFDRWAEPLDRNIERVVARNLSVLLDTDRVFVLPARRPLDLRYRVVIDILRFNLVKEGETLLEVRWAVLDGESRRELLIATSTHVRPVAVQNYDAVVSSMNENLAELSREIATAISSLQPGQQG
jgi:uncharacterized lipoprotein YmbA